VALFHNKKKEKIKLNSFSTSPKPKDLLSTMFPKDQHRSYPNGKKWYDFFQAPILDYAGRIKE
jgi:hypothetical protein